MFKLIIFSLIIYLNKFECNSLSSLFKLKHKIVSAKGYFTTSSFESSNYIYSQNNLDYLICIQQCSKVSACISAIHTRFNNSLSLCSMYNNVPSKDIDFILGNIDVVSQKLVQKQIISNLYFFLIFILKNIIHF